MRTLDQLQQGELGRIMRIRSRGALRQRLLDMGITRGAHIRITRRAPLGDPIQIAVKGYYLAIRSNEAQYIEVERVRDDHSETNAGESPSNA